jgi:hypothetical protein
MIKYGILIGGIVFYWFAISSLVDKISKSFLIFLGDENFTRSFIRLMDENNDGVITAKEIKSFAPCEEYDGKKITREFQEFGRKADINDYSQSITPKNGIFYLKFSPQRD